MLHTATLTLHYTRFDDQRAWGEPQCVISMPGTWRTATGEFDVVVTALSSDGLIVEAPELIEEGTIVAMRCTGVILNDAVVEWQDGKLRCSFIRDDGPHSDVA